MKVLETAVGALFAPARFSLVRISVRDLVADGKSLVRNSGVGGGGPNRILIFNFDTKMVGNRRVYGKGGLGLRGVAFMTVLAVLTVLTSTLPSCSLSYKIQHNEATVAVLAVSAAVAVAVVTATPLKPNPPFFVILKRV